MSYALAGKQTAELQNIVANFLRGGKTDSAYYADALRELGTRRHKKFSLQTTLDYLVEAARHRRFVSYKDVAVANGLTWSQAHLPMPKHLDLVCEYASSKKMPLLTAIVVNAESVSDGQMSLSAREGFMASARRLGARGIDDEAFVRDEQVRVFDYFSGASAA